MTEVWQFDLFDIHSTKQCWKDIENGRKWSWKVHGKCTRMNGPWKILENHFHYPVYAPCSVALLVLEQLRLFRLFSCIIAACMLYYCIMVRWAWLDRGMSGWLTTLLPCFDTVGWVIRPVKTVSRITYIVLVQTLNHARSMEQLSVEWRTCQLWVLKIAGKIWMLPLW